MATERGREYRRGGRAAEEALRQRIAELCAEGISGVTIAARLGCSQNLVSRVRRAEGGHLMPTRQATYQRGPLPRERQDARIRSLLADGQRGYEIAARLKVDPNRVSAIRKAMRAEKAETGGTCL